MKKLTPPFRIGKKQLRSVLDSKGIELVVFHKGLENYAKEYVDFLNSDMSKNNQNPIKYDCSIIDSINFIELKTIQELICKSYDITIEEFNEIDSFSIFQYDNGKIVNVEIEKSKYIDTINDMGFAGVADTNKKEILFWVGQKATKKDILDFFSHELAHFVGFNEKNIHLEEYRALSYQTVAVKAFNLMEKYFQNEKIN